MTTYPGLPGPVICDFLSREASRARYAPGVEFQIGRIEMVANTGTYVDSPFHRYADGNDLAELAARVARRSRHGVVIARARGRAIDRTRFAGRELGGSAVLVRTGWDAHWGTRAYLEGNPFLTARRRRPGSTDRAPRSSASTRSTSTTWATSARPVHSTLLGAGIPIVEHLCRTRTAAGRRLPLLRGAGEGGGRSAPGPCARSPRCSSPGIGSPSPCPSARRPSPAFPPSPCRPTSSKRSSFPPLGMKLTNLRRRRGREWLWRNDQIPLAVPAARRVVRRHRRQRRVGRVLPDRRPVGRSRARRQARRRFPTTASSGARSGRARCTNTRMGPRWPARREGALLPYEFHREVTLDPAGAGGAVTLPASSHGRRAVSLALVGAPAAQRPAGHDAVELPGIRQVKLDAVYGRGGSCAGGRRELAGGDRRRAGPFVFPEPGGWAMKFFGDVGRDGRFVLTDPRAGRAAGDGRAPEEVPQVGRLDQLRRLGAGGQAAVLQPRAGALHRRAGPAGRGGAAWGTFATLAPGEERAW